MNLVASFRRLVESAAASLSAPSRDNLLTVVSGWLFAARRTVTSCLVATGAVGTKHHSAFHRLFASARWSLDRVGLSVFRLLRPWCPAGRVLLALDDTRANKRGTKMYGAGMHYDPLVSTRSHKVVTWGLSWVVLAVTMRFPFAPKHAFSLPILFRLYLNKNAAKRWKVPYRSRPELGLELLQMMAQHHPRERFHVVADESYGGHKVLTKLPTNVGLTSRLNLDARLYTAVAPRRGGQVGRPRRRGTRLPTPKAMVADARKGRRVELDLYGRKDLVRMVETQAYVHHAPTRPLKIVVQKPLQGGRPIQAFFSTDAEQETDAMLQEYEGRWSIEECFRGSKTFLGFEQSQGWSKMAVLRTSPLAMLLYSLIVLWFAREGHQAYEAVERPWYRSKRGASFADMLTTLRRACVKATVSRGAGGEQGYENLLDTLLIAA